MQEPDKHWTHAYLLRFPHSVLEHSARLRTGAMRGAQFRAEAAGRIIEISHVAFVISMVQWTIRQLTNAFAFHAETACAPLAENHTFA